MHHVPFGTSGIEVSELCLGTMMFGQSCDKAETDRILSAAIEQGADFLDTAAAYRHGEGETLLGRLLRGRRDRVCITTKFPVAIPPHEIVPALNESLQRLQTDHVDIFLLHFPTEAMDARATMSAMNDAVKAGKTRAIGCCNCPAWLVEHFNAIAAVEGWAPVTCHQVPYNPIERGVEIEVLPQALTTGVAVTIYRSLLMGVLSGKYRSNDEPPAGSRGDLDRKNRPGSWATRYAEAITKFNAYADELGATPAQLAIAWVRHCPAVTCPLVGVRSIQQLESTIKAFELDLTDEQHVHVTDLFDAEIREEAGGNYPKLRRNMNLVARERT